MKQNLAVKIWQIVYPLGMYYVIICIAMFFAQLLIGRDNGHYMICQIAASIVTLPFIYSFYLQDRHVEGAAQQKLHIEKEHLLNLLLGIVIVLFISFALNNLIIMSPLADISEGYEEASNAFYGSVLALELIGSALIAPLLEELLYRGVLFARMRKMMPCIPAALVSALIFGVMHFNLVQFVYAFLLGIVLSLLMERAGHIYPAIAGHICANTVAVLRTELHFLDWSMDDSVLAYVSSILALLIGASLLAFYCRPLFARRTKADA